MLKTEDAAAAVDSEFEDYDEENSLDEKSVVKDEKKYCGGELEVKLHKSFA